VSVVPIVVTHRRRDQVATHGVRVNVRTSAGVRVVARLACGEYARGLRTKAVDTRAVTCSQRTSLLIGIAVSANDAPDADVLPST
jgi:hypothetical protein